MRKSAILVTAAILAAPAAAFASPWSLGERALGILEGAVRGDRAPMARPLAPHGPGVHANTWRSDRPVRFDHVIEGPPGPVTLILEAHAVDGNQTVAVYRADEHGVRQTGWRMFVITTRDGNAARGTLTLPPIPHGENQARQPVIVMVENYSGHLSQGGYTLRVAP